MFYFDLYGRLAVLITYFILIGLLLLAAIIYYSVRKYEKPAPKTPEEPLETEHVEHAGHGEPGVPLMLKWLYLGIAVYILAATAWVALSGMKIG
ncbi:MAG: hypothetical protein AB1640_05845 [bacterium]